MAIMSSGVRWAMLGREALVGGRKGWSFGTRMIFVGVLLSITLLAWYETMSVTEADLSTLPQMGRNLFMTFMVAQMMLICLMTPLMVSAGVIQEKEEGTIDMLVLTRLTTSQILWGKISSRLIQLELLMVSSLPVLFMIAALGGVAPEEIVASFLLANGAMILTAAMASLMAVICASPLTASLLCYLYQFLFFIVIPSPLAIFSVESIGWASPLMALGALYSPTMSPLLASLGPLIFALATALLLGLAISPLFDMVVTADFNHEGRLGLLSHSLWRIERMNKAMHMTVAFIVVVMPLVRYLVPHPLVDRVWYNLFLLVTTWGFVRVVLRLSPNPRRPAPSTLPRRRADKLDRLRDNPVAWREWHTNTLGGLTFITRRISIALAIPFGLYLLLGGYDVGELNLGLSLMAMPLIIFLSAFTSSYSMALEKSAGTLELLILTDISPTKIMAGKVLGVIRHMALPLTMTLALLLIGLLAKPKGGTLLFATLFLLWAALFALALILASLWLALRCKKAMTAVIMSSAMALLLLFLPVILELLPDEVAKPMGLMNVIYYDELMEALASSYVQGRPISKVLRVLMGSSLLYLALVGLLGLGLMRKLAYPYGRGARRG